MTTVTATKSRKQSVNLLLDKINKIPEGNMSEKLGEIRQKLIQLKELNSKTGNLMLVDNTSEVLSLINATKPW